MCPQSKLEPFLSIAGQTLESFIKSLDDDAKPQQCYNSHEHHFVLALAGVVTSEGTEIVLNTNCHDIFIYYHLKDMRNGHFIYSFVLDVAAVSCGRDFLSSSAHILLATLMQLLGLMKPGVFPRLKVYVTTLKYTSEKP